MYMPILVNNHLTDCLECCARQVDTRGCVLFTMDVCRLLGLEEADLLTDTQSHLLRLLVPVLKLFTAKKVMYSMYSTS